MQTAPEPIDAVQKGRLNRALGITSEQIRQAQSLLEGAGLIRHSDDPYLLGAVITALAMNYGAEVHAVVGLKG
jgi:hypothetical protein